MPCTCLFIHLFIFLKKSLTVALTRLFCSVALQSKNKAPFKCCCEAVCYNCPWKPFFQLHCAAVAHRNWNAFPHFWAGEVLLICSSHMLNCKCGTIFVSDNCFVDSRECFCAPGRHTRVTQLELVMCPIWNRQRVSAFGSDLSEASKARRLFHSPSCVSPLGFCAALHLLQVVWDVPLHTTTTRSSYVIAAWSTV